MSEGEPTPTERRSPRRGLRFAAVGVALACTALLATPAVIRGHAKAVRAEIAASHPNLAWLGATRPSENDNWVAQRLREVAAPLVADRGWRGRVGVHATPDVPPAPGVRELRQWLDRELADPCIEIRPLPAVAASHLRTRSLDLDRIQEILLSGDDIRWGWRDHGTLTREHVLNLLLADALESARSARGDQSRRRILAAWRLAQSAFRQKSAEGRGMVERVAVALRRLPDIPPEWIDRLDTDGIRTIHVREYARISDGTLRFYERYPKSLAEAGKEVTFIDARTIHAEYGWQELRLARRRIALALELDDPGRCGRSVSFDPILGTRHATLARRMDRLVVQLELTRKVAQVHAARRMTPEGEWPECIDGLEISECQGLSWTYSGGRSMMLEPQGPAIAWLEAESLGPALRVVTR